MDSKTNIGGGAFGRVSGLAAIGFAAIILLANLLIAVPAGLPNTGADAAEVAEFFSAESGAVGLMTAFLPAAWMLAAVFGAGVFAAVRDGERDRAEAWSLVGFAGLILQNTTITAVSAIRLALANTGAEAAPDALWAVHDALFTLNGAFLALALLGLSIAGRRAGLIRPWHAVLGFAAAALQFTSATLAAPVTAHGGALGLIGLAGWLLWVLWLVCYGLALFKGRNASR
ncbi:MAG: hypothetical protein HOQ43_00325 [Glycomyces artemisiae]|uniref:DUF4386 family protein n=1 Tax=Glycomyces artemisiae TaxID=1076443 RepID=A0A850C2Y5_9ACTN|nr:hypothetical protein [Glycomyces artemisiae]